MAEQAFPLRHLCGWVDDPARHALAATFAPPLSQVAPHLMAAPPVENALLYKAWKDVDGKYPSYVAQQIGDCTSFGSGHANDLNIAVEMILGKPWLLEETCTEFIYSMGRKIANMRRSGDGCYGVAVAKALVTYGAVPRSLVGPYSGQRAKQWGDMDPAQNIIDEAAKHKVGNAALLTSTEELRAAIANGYPCAGGFSQGFVMHRDSNGCCAQSGRWGHEQCCPAYRSRGGSFEYLLLQSWGPNVPDGPLTDDQPDFSFWITEQSMASIVSQQDFLAFSGAAGFHVRDLPSGWKKGDFYP